MSQRNPLNERYTTDEHRGTTRKSAASAKPKSKAAASVRMEPEKTRKEKKAEEKAKRKEERAKQDELDQMYYNPPTERYKRLRRIWWVLLVAAIVCTVVAFAANSFLPKPVTYVTLAGAYGFCIAAIVLDCTAIRKERQAYQKEITETKEYREAEKQKKAAQREVERKHSEEAKEAEAEPEAKKSSKRFGSKKKKKQEAQAAAAEQGAADVAASK